MKDINNYCVTIFNSQNKNLTTKQVLDEINSSGLSINEKVNLLTELHDTLFKLTMGHFDNREYLELIRLVIEKIEKDAQ